MGDVLNTGQDANPGVVCVTADEVEKYSGVKVIKLGQDVFRDDFDPELFIADDCYQMYLSAVQQGRCSHPDVEGVLGGTVKYDRDTVFEGFLTDMLRTLWWRRGELKRERAQGHLDQPYYQECLKLVEMSEAAIKKFLEKTERQRLIGI